MTDKCIKNVILICHNYWIVTKNHFDLLSLSGDFLSAFGNLGLLANVENGNSAARRRRRDTSERRVRRQAADVTSETAAEQLELIGLTLTETVLTTSSAQMLIDNTASMAMSNMTLEDQGKLG